jgi:DNA-directed RNA polymerase subunit M/transcription elongation factor TFIIS
MKKLDRKIFMNKCNEIHENKYDYSLVEYINARLKVKIICPEHGIFEQRPYHHLNGGGCPKCSFEKNKREKSNIYEFIKKSKKVHDDKYNYYNSLYLGSLIKLEIICNKCGNTFYQKPNDHLNGRGCPKCAIDNQKTKINIFIKKSKKIHENKYDYSLVIYKNTHTKIDIICPIHGIFKQTPNNHLQKKGCPKCGNIKIRIKRIKQIEKDKFNGNQIIPSYNKKACLLFDNIMKKTHTHIQHAMNDGEFYIKELGYWVDGYDKENNIVYEFDESHHFDKNGNLREKDITRQQEISQLLRCEFIRLK